MKEIRAIRGYSYLVIDTRTWSALSGLMLTAKRLVDGLYAGGHASRRFGAGLDFHDYRPYTPGDDPGDVDWKLYGRTDRHYLKRYQRQTDLHLYLLVDASASMRYAPGSLHQIFHRRERRDRRRACGPDGPGPAPVDIDHGLRGFHGSAPIPEIGEGRSRRPPAAPCLRNRASPAVS